MKLQLLAVAAAFVSTATLTSVLPSVAEAQYTTTCTTSSRGRSFTERDYDNYRARQRVIEQCQRDQYTSNSECEYNVRCDGNGGGGGGGGYPPPYGYGSIQAYRQNCYSDMCTYQISWRTGYGNSSVVTVQIPGESGEKLMSCESSYGNATAPWVAPGKTYIFRLYDSSQCTADVGRYSSPSATVNVYGGQ